MPSPIPARSGPCRPGQFSKQEAAGEGGGADQEWVSAAVPALLNDDGLGRRVVCRRRRGRVRVAVVAGSGAVGVTHGRRRCCGIVTRWWRDWGRRWRVGSGGARRGGGHRRRACGDVQVDHCWQLLLLLRLLPLGGLFWLLPVAGCWRSGGRGAHCGAVGAAQAGGAVVRGNRGPALAWSEIIARIGSRLRGWQGWGLPSAAFGQLARASWRARLAALWQGG